MNLVLGGAASGVSAAPAPCSLEVAEMRIEVRSEPDDGVWGPTLEVEVADDLRPLSRLMAPESRPIEQCWWADIDRDGQPELVIGLGPEPARHLPPGLLLYAWRDQRLTPGRVPALPAASAGLYRYVVKAQSLWAFPVGASGPDARGAFRLEGGHWHADTPP